MATVWVVVADRLRARVFEAEYPHSPLRERDLATDNLGRRGAGPDAHGVEEGQPPMDQEGERFAREVADCLGEAARERQFERLVACAGRRFLGLLRAELAGAAGERVSLELDNDRAHTDGPEEIRQHLPERL